MSLVQKVKQLRLALTQQLSEKLEFCCFVDSKQNINTRSIVSAPPPSRSKLLAFTFTPTFLQLLLSSAKNVVSLALIVCSPRTDFFLESVMTL